MSDTTYKGDSPGKALVRFRAWAAIRTICQSMQIPFQGALVLAGEGGDLGVLQGLGIDLSKVVAVDRDPFMVEWCKHNHPEIQGYAGDLTDAACQTPVPYNTAHIDLCGGLRKADNILTAARVMMGVHTHPAVVAVTMLKGREGKARTHLMDGARRNHRRQLLRKATKKGDALKQLVYSTDPWDSLKALGVVKARMRDHIRNNPEFNTDNGVLNRAGNFTGHGSALARSVLLHHSVEHIWEAWDRDAELMLPSDEKLHMQQVGVMSYHSGTDDDKGTPFVTCLYFIYRSCQTEMAQYLVHSQLASSERGGPVILPYQHLDLKEGMKALKPTIASLGRKLPHDRVAAMFGIEAKSIPALIAHDTRGSYQGRKFGRLAKTGRTLEVDEDGCDLKGWGDLESMFLGKV